MMQGYASINPKVAALAEAADRDPAVIEEFRHHHSPGFAEILRDTMKNILFNRGVCCLSALNDHLLMWGHYADGHRGFCLQFDTAEDPMFERATEVHYSRDLPTVSIQDSLGTPNPELITKVLATKHEDWSYEREWRVIHQESNKAYYHRAEALSAVYLGAEIGDDSADLVAAATAHTGVAIYHFRKSSTQFALGPPILLRAKGE